MLHFYWFMLCLSIISTITFLVVGLERKKITLSIFATTVIFWIIVVLLNFSLSSRNTIQYINPQYSIITKLPDHSINLILYDNDKIVLNKQISNISEVIAIQDTVNHIIKIKKILSGKSTAINYSYAILKKEK